MTSLSRKSISDVHKKLCQNTLVALKRISGPVIAQADMEKVRKEHDIVTAKREASKTLGKIKQEAKQKLECNIDQNEMILHEPKIPIPKPPASRASRQLEGSAPSSSTAARPVTLTHKDDPSLVLNYSSLSEAARAIGAKHSNVSTAAQQAREGNTRTVKGFFVSFSS